jgi:hypothetical protein
MVTDTEILSALRSLSPEAREWVVAVIRSLAGQDQQHARSPEERLRILRSTFGSIPAEEARELLRIGREEFDTIDEEMWR